MNIPGIVFDLGDNWLYALESAIDYVPGTFGSTKTFTVDKNGAPFASGNEYRLWAKNPVLNVSDPVLYIIYVDDYGTVTTRLGPADAPGGASSLRQLFAGATDTDLRFAFSLMLSLFPTLRYSLGLPYTARYPGFYDTDFNPTDFET